MAQPSAGQPAQEAHQAPPSAALVLEREADANLANHFSSVQARLQTLLGFLVRGACILSGKRRVLYL